MAYKTFYNSIRFFEYFAIIYAYMHIVNSYLTRYKKWCIIYKNR